MARPRLHLRVSCVLVLSGIAAAAPPAVNSTHIATPGAGVHFEPNQGQADSRVHHLSRTPHGVIYFSGDSVVLHRAGSNHSLRFEFIHTNGNDGPLYVGADMAAGSFFYMVGRDTRQWAQNVPRYRRLERRNLYHGIDLIYYGDDSGNLEYDLLLLPEASPASIRLRVVGAQYLTTDSDGALVVQPPHGPPVRQRKPQIYQAGLDGSRRDVPGRFVLRGGGDVGFEVGAHDESLPLSIDPVIDAAAYLGGAGEDRVVSWSPLLGALGSTSSIDFPGQATRRRGRDVFFQFGSSTYIFGGSGDDEPLTGAERLGPAWAFGGVTDSPDLPTTYTDQGQVVRGWQPDFAGGPNDGFVAVFSFSLRKDLAVSTRLVSYVGGPGEDRVTATDPNSRLVTFAGTTTEGGFQPATGGRATFIGPGGHTDGFLAEFPDPSIAWLTYFGGSGDDFVNGLVWDWVRDSYFVTGETRSADFPTPGRRQERRGDADGFVLRLDRGGRQGQAGVLFGGSGSDRATSITMAEDGGVIIAGATNSADLPIVNARQPSFGGGASDAFFARLSRDLSQVLAASYLGGSSDDEATAISANAGGDFAVGGWTKSSDFPNANAVQSRFGGGSDDGFVAHFGADSSAIQISYYGGTGSDRILGVALANAPTITIWGQTTSNPLPAAATTESMRGGGTDGFVATISTETIPFLRMIGARGLRRQWSVFLRSRSSPARVPVNISSSDPNLVLIATRQDHPGTGSIELPPGETDFWLDCLSERPASLTLTAAGFGQRTVPVVCGAPRVQILFTGVWKASGETIRVVQGAPGFSVSAVLQVVEPETGLQTGEFVPQPGGEVVRVSVRSTDDAILRPASMFWTVRSSRDDVKLSALAYGEAELLFDSNYPLSQNTAKVMVTSLLEAWGDNVSQYD